MSTTTGRPQTITACRHGANDWGRVVANRKPANCVAGSLGNDRGATPSAQWAMVCSLMNMAGLRVSASAVGPRRDGAAAELLAPALPAADGRGGESRAASGTPPAAVAVGSTALVSPVWTPLTCCTNPYKTVSSRAAAAVVHCGASSPLPYGLCLGAMPAGDTGEGGCAGRAVRMI